jgi:hypothetical protein
MHSEPMRCRRCPIAGATLLCRGSGAETRTKLAYLDSAAWTLLPYQRRWRDSSPSNGARTTPRARAVAYVPPEGARCAVRGVVLAGAVALGAAPRKDAATDGAIDTNSLRAASLVAIAVERPALRRAWRTRQADGDELRRAWHVDTCPALSHDVRTPAGDGDRRAQADSLTSAQAAPCR